MSQLAIKKEIKATVEEGVEKVTAAIKELGFGILTRIDFDQKIKEKLGETIPKTVILGACNPKLAFSAYQHTTDVTLLVPCNVVVRDIGSGRVAVEAIRLTSMMSLLSGLKMEDEMKAVETAVEKAILAL